MPSLDLFVGFEGEPIDLEGFLSEKGYVPSEDQPEEKGDRIYEPADGTPVDVFYFAKVIPQEEGDVPDWEASGYKITSELMISTKEDDAIDDAEKIARELVEKYNGVFYDTDLDEFFGKGEL
jgi:hypothetical protein